MSDSSAKLLHERLEELQSRTRLAKCAPSLEELSQNRAAMAFHAGIEAAKVHGTSQRALARRLKRDERTLRDWADGSRVVPAWAFCALPPEGQTAALLVLANEVPSFDEHEEDDTDEEPRVA